MKKLIRLIGILANIVFVAVFTYFMFAMVGLGGNDFVLYIGVATGLISIISGMIDLFNFIDSDLVSQDSHLDRFLKKPPLYANIQEVGGFWYFHVFSQNHETICASDSFATYDGALTGLWYLMDSMKKMDELSWDLR